MPAPESNSPEVEQRNHRYVGSRIPWFVHLIWISFWLFAVYYVIRWLFPAMQREFLSPP